MVKYIIKRILLSLLILFGVSILLYSLVRMMPVDWVMNKLASSIGSSDSGGTEFEARKQQLYAYYGLNTSVFEGYLKWLGQFVRGEFGKSFKTGQPVEKIIFQNMGVSFAISFISMILQLLISIPLGIKCACNQYGKLDYTATVLAMIGISFPAFFFGSLAIKFFSVELGWFPVNGLQTPGLSVEATDWEKFWDMVWHLILPITVLVILNIGSMMRYTRTNTLEVLNADYIRTARAKGLSENKVVYKHVFRNTMIPLVTTLAGLLPGLFGGSMITETIFGIPGIGKTAYDLLSAGDIPFVMAYNMFIATLTVIGILLTDIMYAVVDPRVKLGK